MVGLENKLIKKLNLDVITYGRTTKTHSGIF